MKKRAILLGILLSIGSLAFSATTDPILLKIPSLKTLSEKVDAQIKKVNDAATSSRSAGQAAQADLTAAYTEYAVELKKQKEEATDAVVKTAIDKELQLVNEKLSATNSSNKSK